MPVMDCYTQLTGIDIDLEKLAIYALRAVR